MNSNEIDLNEWIVHNILIGFEHIYIYDDNSNPNIKDIISVLPINIMDCVTIYRLDCDYEINNGEYINKKDNLLYFDESIYRKHKQNKQRYLMNYFLKTHKTISKYCFFCDVDEFIYLRDHITIQEYLNTMDNYNIIYIPWIYYGTSYYINKPKGVMMDNFRCHCSKYDCGKSIIKMSNVDEIYDIHKINPKNPNYFEYDRSAPLFSLPIHINHYITKAFKSVLIKKKEHCLGQTNEFYRTIPHIIGLGNGVNLNSITSNHIMEKYIYKINDILKYELNDNHNDYNKYKPGIIIMDNIEMSYSYVNNNSNMNLLIN